MFEGRSTADVILILGALGTVAGLVAGAIVSVLKAFGDIRELRRDFAVVAKDTEAIKGHVNSEKTASQGREAMKDQEIALLRAQLTDEKLTRRLLAQAASHQVASPSGTAPADGAAVETLQQIETHTADTAENTKRLEEKVTVLEDKS